MLLLLTLVEIPPRCRSDPRVPSYRCRWVCARGLGCQQNQRGTVHAHADLHSRRPRPRVIFFTPFATHTRVEIKRPRACPWRWTMCSTQIMTH